MNDINVVINSNLSAKAYTDWTESDKQNATVAFTDKNGNNWSIYDI